MGLWIKIILELHILESQHSIQFISITEIRKRLYFCLQRHSGICVKFVGEAGNGGNAQGANTPLRFSPLSRSKRICLHPTVPIEWRARRAESSLKAN